ncbi:hypothetical protein HU200_047443 [Digitaria exilis]|uniref:X8 domain-containing protein n=1 Tax=Digitaria exilis TaxID=1010633 RepID=A0A835AY31_9POAL|nr:hypothetical protein HU200_047443 [Digitaria exilis]
MDAGKARPLLYTSSSSSSCPSLLRLPGFGRRVFWTEIKVGIWRDNDMGHKPLMHRLGFIFVLVALCGGELVAEVLHIDLFAQNPSISSLRAWLRSNAFRVISTGTEHRRAEAADGATPHRTLTTVSVSKPSYPTVTTPMSAYAYSSPGSPSPTFPTLATGNGGAGAGAGAGGGGGGGGSWCVASQSANPTALQVALDYACGYGADCSAIQPGGSCFNPDTVHDHASYAFNSYYQKNPVPTSCDFGGTATITNTDPSSGSCQYPASSGGTQTTMPPPSPTTTMPPSVPTTPMTPTPTTPDTGTPVYGMSPPDYGSMSPPDYGSTSPPGYGSTSPPDYNDVGAAATTGQGRAVLALLCVLVATISLHVSK